AEVDDLCVSRGGLVAALLSDGQRRAGRGGACGRQGQGGQQQGEVQQVHVHDSPPLPRAHSLRLRPQTRPGRSVGPRRNNVGRFCDAVREYKPLLSFLLRLGSGAVSECRSSSSGWKRSNLGRSQPAEQTIPFRRPTLWGFLASNIMAGSTCGIEQRRK